MRKLSAAAPRSAVLALATLLILPMPSRAASTGQTALHTPQGSDAAGSNGEYVADALNTFYRYFIEVPPGLSRLVVEVWDPDIGRGGNNDESNGRDRDRTDYDTQADYILIRPDGSQASTLSNCDDNTCNDNTWTAILNSTTAQNTAAGHWELRVDLRSTGDDINAIGVRAHDGTSGSGGTELPVYIDSIGAFGVNPPGSGTVGRNYDVYPWITSGCSASVNDFDYDSNGALTLSSRTGSFSQSYSDATFSGNNAWNRETFSGWTTDQNATDYGLWHLDLTVDSYLVGSTPNGNYINFWMGNFQSASATPAANPVTNSFRIYLPTDGGAAPVKPYVEQLLTHKSGNNPVVVGQTSRYQVTVRLVNPTTRPIVFSASNLVTANIPGGGAGLRRQRRGGPGIDRQPAVGGRHGQHHLEPGDRDSRDDDRPHLPGGRDARLGGAAAHGDRHPGFQRYAGAIPGRDRQLHADPGHLPLRPAVRAGGDREPADGRRGLLLPRPARRGRRRAGGVEHGLGGGHGGLRSPALGQDGPPLGAGEPGTARGAPPRAAGRRLPLRGRRRFARRAPGLPPDRGGGRRRPPRPRPLPCERGLERSSRRRERL